MKNGTTDFTLGNIVFLYYSSRLYKNRVMTVCVHVCEFGGQSRRNVWKNCNLHIYLSLAINEQKRLLSKAYGKGR